MSLVHQFVRDESGATAIEYALIAALVSVFAIVGLTAFANTFNTLMGDVTTQFTTATN